MSSDLRVPLTKYHKAQMRLMWRMVREDIKWAACRFWLLLEHIFLYLLALVRGGTI